MAQAMIDIDGGVMEGGGQILRMATAFSALLQKPIHIYNIRAGRSTPGLRPQHLAGLQLVAEICNGKLQGGEIGSTEIKFFPGKIKSGKFFADPKTAGSIMLLFQVSFPCLLFADGPTELLLRGGTNAEMAPQIDHTLTVFKPVIEQFGVKFDCKINKRGYFPKGGGEAVITATPVTDCLKCIELLQPGDVTEFKGRAFVAGTLPIKMSHLMADSAMNLIKSSFKDAHINIERLKEPQHLAVGNGSGILVTAKTSTGCLLGGSALGKRDVTASAVGEAAARQLINGIKSGSCVDEFTQDQLIIFMVLAKGTSRLRCGKLTLHSETAIYIAEKLTEAKFTISKDEIEDCSIIECVGIGLQR